MWTTKITSIALSLAASCLFFTSTASANDTEEPLSGHSSRLEEVVQFTDSPVTAIDTIVESQAKNTNNDISNYIAQTVLDDINEKIINNFVEKIEPAQEEVSSGELTQALGARNTSFSWGNCTYYVAQKKYVTWGGNAKDWYYNAKAKGVSVGHTPKAWAIIVFKAGNGYHPRYGHVGIVEKVNNNGSILISEMNAKGLGVVSTRTVKLDHKILWYIYAK